MEISPRNVYNFISWSYKKVGVMKMPVSIVFSKLESTFCILIGSFS